MHEGPGQDCLTCSLKLLGVLGAIVKGPQIHVGKAVSVDWVNNLWLTLAPQSFKTVDWLIKCKFTLTSYQIQSSEGVITYFLNQKTLKSAMQTWSIGFLLAHLVPLCKSEQDKPESSAPTHPQACDLHENALLSWYILTFKKFFKLEKDKFVIWRMLWTTTTKQNHCLPFQWTMYVAQHQPISHSSRPLWYALQGIQDGEKQDTDLRQLRCLSKKKKNPISPNLCIFPYIKSIKIMILRCLSFVISSNLLMFDYMFFVFQTKTTKFPGSSLTSLEQFLRAIYLIGCLLGCSPQQVP